MARDNDRYWQRQGIMDSLRLTKAQRAAARRASAIFDAAADDIAKELDAWYKRYATVEGVTIEEARRTFEDRTAYSLTLERYHALLEQFPNDPVAKRLLDVNHIGSRISRLEYLQLQLNELQTAMYGRLEGLTRQEAIQNYEDAYYRGIYEQHKWQGLATPFSRLNPQAVAEIIEQPIRAKNFSERIWGDHRQQLADRLNQIIGAGLANGASKDDMANQLRAQMDMSESRARTLIRSEVGRARSRSSLESMRANGTPQYKFIATLDFLTSIVCRQHDGLIEDVDKAIIGTNYPPLHPNCRSVGAPHWPPEEGDEDYDDTRFARASDGTSYKVPASMTYGQWYDKYVRANPEELLGYTMQRNAIYDKGQYARYLERGVQVEDSFADFQRVKYTDYKTWELRKQQYRALGKLQSGKLPTKINAQKQARHIRGSGYVDGRSYVTVPLQELQKTVDQYSGTGTTFFRGPSMREKVNTNRDIGVILYLDGRDPTPTSWVMIHYSNTGVHVVPTKGDATNDE
ncbi:minor capsid protein [Christensenellaceae bacterium OttesenSCG-928-M15]|nr:minor capsid protein [Christensenellaceae bacterium OttesenSCG-928-M15]